MTSVSKFAVLALAAVAATAFAAENGKKSAKPKRPNPLSALPSKPGAHVAKIKALGEDAWLNLGKPAPDPKWGMGRGRAYSPKMAYASDLNGAFYAGCGRHGYVKPDKHFMDDMFFYDAAAHKWICLHPGATKTMKLKLNEHNFEVTLDGINHPVSFLSHAYNMVTYNSKLRKYMLIYHYSPWWTKAIPQRGDWLGIAPKDRGNPYRAGKLNGNPKHPVFWNVDANRWERQFVADKVSPGKNLGILEYIPEKEQAFYMGNRTPHYYDFKTNKWISTEAVLPAKIKYDYVGCYDSKRSRIYMLYRADMYSFDMKANKWTVLEKAPRSFGYSTQGQLNFDSASGMVIGIAFGPTKDGKHPGGAYVYDPDKNTWTAPTSKMPAIRGTGASFYHAKYNVHYLHRARDSTDNGVMLVYRYKKASEEETVK